MGDPDEDEVMIGEVQVTEFDDWQQKEYEGILRERQSQKTIS